MDNRACEEEVHGGTRPRAQAREHRRTNRVCIECLAKFHVLQTRVADVELRRLAVLFGVGREVPRVDLAVPQLNVSNVLDLRRLFPQAFQLGCRCIHLVDRLLQVEHLLVFALLASRFPTGHRGDIRLFHGLLRHVEAHLVCWHPIVHAPLNWGSKRDGGSPT